MSITKNVIIMPVVGRDIDGLHVIQCRVGDASVRRLRKAAKASWDGDVGLCASELLRTGLALHYASRRRQKRTGRKK